MVNLLWPHRLFGYQSSPEKAEKLAQEIITIFGNNPDAWLDAGRFEVKEKEQPRSSFDLEALCLPMDNDRFRFVLYVGPNDHPIRRTFLIAHESAHTFFYIRKPSQRPKRTMLSSDWEETFCDAFAETVTGHKAEMVGLYKSEPK